MWFNPIIRLLLKSPLHFTISQSVMLLTYRGRKSGKTYTTPLSYLDIDGSLYTLSSRERVWWRNLRGGADVMLLVKGQRFAARCVVVEEREEVAAALCRYLRQAPERAKHFDFRSDQAGSPLEVDLSKLAGNKVVVKFKTAIEEQAAADGGRGAAHPTLIAQEV